MGTSDEAHLSNAASRHWRTRRGAVLVFLISIAQSACANHQLAIDVGFDRNGGATSSWRTAVEEHTGAAQNWTPTSVTPEEAGWLDLMRAHRDIWRARIPALARPFGDIKAPAVVVRVGHQHGEDAFGLGTAVVHFDLSALAKNYGVATAPGNATLLDRLFDHEYTHVLHWRWAATHPQPAATPLQRALWRLAREGLGNMYSLSPSWVAADGSRTPLADATLAELTPIFVERVSALQRATSEEEPELTRGLSSGPFHKKWGALPVALWLADERRHDPKATARFVEGGAPAVLALARRHLTARDAARLPVAP